MIKSNEMNNNIIHQNLSMEAVPLPSFLKAIPITLSVNTTQINQINLIMSKSEVLIFFQDHCQLWDIDNNICFHRGKPNQSFYFYSIPAKITPTSVAVVNLQNLEPKLLIYDIKNDESSFVANLNDESNKMNFTNIFYFEKNQYISVVSKGQKKVKLNTWTPLENYKYQEIEERQFDEQVDITKYNGETVSKIRTSKDLSFDLINLTNNTCVSYNLNGILEQDEKLVEVDQYSSHQAIVGSHRYKTSTVIILDILSKEVIRKTSICFTFDHLIRNKWYWIAICTTEEEGNSSCMAVRLFAEVEGEMQQSNVEKVEIPRWIREWNKYYPILVTSGDSENQDKQILKICKAEFQIPKRPTFLHLLEKSGIIGDFGSEVVRAVMWNFNEGVI